MASSLSTLGYPEKETVKPSYSRNRLRSLFKGMPVQSIEKQHLPQTQTVERSLHTRFKTAIQDLNTLKNNQTGIQRPFSSMPHKTPLKIGEVVYLEQKTPQIQQPKEESPTPQASSQEDVPENPLPEVSEFGKASEALENDQASEKEDSEEIERLKEQVLFLQMQLARRRRENANLLQNTEGLTNKLNETTKKLEEEQEKQKNIILIGGNRIIHDQQQQTSLQQQTNNFKKEIETRIREIQARASEKEGNLVSQNAVLQNQYEASQRLLESEKNQFISDRNQWSHDKNDLLSQLNSLQSNYETAKNQLDVQKDKAILAKQRRKTNENEIERLKVLIETLRRELEEEQRRSYTLKGNNDILRNQLIAAQNDARMAQDIANQERLAKEQEIEARKRVEAENERLRQKLTNSNIAPTTPVKNGNFNYLRSVSVKSKDDSSLGKKGTLITTKPNGFTLQPNLSAMDPHSIETQYINQIKFLIDPKDPDSVVLDKNNLQTFGENIKKLTQTNNPNAALSLADVLQKNEDLEQHNNHLINQIYQQQNDKNQTERKNTNLNKQLKKVQDENANLTRKITQLKNNNVLFQADIQNLRAQSAQTQRNNVDLEIKVQQLTVDNNALNSQLIQIKSEQDKQKAISERTNEENKKLNEENKNLIDNQQNLKNQNKQLQNANDNLIILNGRLISDNTAHTNLIQTLKDELENLKNENKNLADQNKKVQTDQADLKKRIDQLVQEKTQLITDNQNLGIQLNKSQQDYTNLENKVHQLTKSNKDLTNQLTNTQAILTSNNIAHTNLENEVKDLRKFQGSVEKMLQNINNSFQNPNNNNFGNSLKNSLLSLFSSKPGPIEEKIQDLGQNIIHRFEQISQQTNQVQQENEKIRAALNLPQNGDPQTAIQQLKQVQQEGNELKAQLAQMNQFLAGKNSKGPKSTDSQTNQLYTAIEQLKKDKDQLQLDNDQVITETKAILSKAQEAPVGEITTAKAAMQQIAQVTEQISNSMGGNVNLSLEERLNQLLTTKQQLVNANQQLQLNNHQLSTENTQLENDKNQLLAENTQLKNDKTALSTSCDNEKQRADDLQSQLNQQNNKLQILANGSNLANITDDEHTNIGKIKQHIEISSHQQSELAVLKNQIGTALKLRPNAKLPNNPLTALQRQYEAQGNRAYNKLMQEHECFIKEINLYLSDKKQNVKDLKDVINLVKTLNTQKATTANFISSVVKVVKPEFYVMIYLIEKLVENPAPETANVWSEKYGKFIVLRNAMTTYSEKIISNLGISFKIEEQILIGACCSDDGENSLIEALGKILCEGEKSPTQDDENFKKNLYEKICPEFIKKIPTIVKFTNKKIAQKITLILIVLVNYFDDSNLLKTQYINETKNILSNKATKESFKEILQEMIKINPSIEIPIKNFWDKVKPSTFGDNL